MEPTTDPQEPGHRQRRSLYRGRSPQQIPAYDSVTVSHYLRIPGRAARKMIHSPLGN